MTFSTDFFLKPGVAATVTITATLPGAVTVMWPSLLTMAPFAVVFSDSAVYVTPESGLPSASIALSVAVLSQGPKSWVADTLNDRSTGATKLKFTSVLVL